MVLKKLFFLFLILFSYVPVLAQVDTAWVRRYNGPGDLDDRASALTVNQNGYVYITGNSGVYPSYDLTTIKYAPNGDTVWVRRYNTSSNSENRPNAITIDKNGNLYVAGCSGCDSDSGDYLTIKYSSDGDTLWTRGYAGPGDGDDAATSLAVDSSGNLYVTGFSWGSGTLYDYATIKYSPFGDTLWVRRYNDPQDGADGGFALKMDTSGNVYVAGIKDAFSSSCEYNTIKYDPNGDTLWMRSYGGGTVDTSDTTIGTQVTSALEVVDSGYVYVAGYSGSITSGDYLIIKYNSSGDTLWVRNYNGPGDGIDKVNAIAVDKNGNVYVTGKSTGAGTFYDYATIKYSPSGDTLWVRRYDGPANSDDQANAIALDTGGNAYVTGFSVGTGTLYDYATIKYSPDGALLWIQRYNGPGNGFDLASSNFFPSFVLAVDKSGNVFVTGESRGAASQDFATIKYFQCLAKPGDANGDNQILLSDIVKIINFLFKSAPAPNPLCRGDANGSGTVLLSDIVYLVNFLFKSGPVPLKSNECCL